MNEIINNELAKLQNELSTLGTAVSKIDQAEKLSTEVVKSVQELHGKYKESFDLLEKETKKYYKDNLNDTNKKVSEIIDEIKKQSENSKKTLEDLQSQILKSDKKNTEEVNKLIESHKIQIEKVENLLKSYLDLANSTALLTDKINKIDFARKFDKLYANMSELNIEIRTVKEIALDTAKNETLDFLQKRLKKNNRKTNFVMFLTILSFLAIIFMAYQFVVLKYFPDYDYLKEFLK